MAKIWTRTSNLRDRSVILIQWKTEFRTSELRTKENSDQQSTGILWKIPYNNVLALFTGPEKFRLFGLSNGL